MFVTLVVLMQAFMCFDIILLFPLERDVYLREHTSGLYSSAFYFGRTFAELPLHVGFATIAASISYPMVGFQDDTGKYMAYIVLIVLATLAGSSVLLASGSMAEGLEESNVIATLVLILVMLFDGNWVSDDQLPSWLSFLKHLSFMKLAVGAILKNEFDGLEIVCSSSEMMGTGDDSFCPIKSGTQYLQTRNLEGVDVGENCLLLLVHVIIWRFIAYLGLRFLHTGKSCSENCGGNTLKASVLQEQESLASVGAPV